MITWLYHFALRHPILTVVGVLFVVIIVRIVWRFLKHWKTEHDLTAEDKNLYGEQYFDEQQETLEEQHAVSLDKTVEVMDSDIPEQIVPTPLEASLETAVDEEITTKHTENLIIAFYIRAFNPKGFNGADIFAAMEQVGLKYGEHHIFHYYGLEQLNTTEPIFSIANLLEPGTFSSEKINEFYTPGLACFMCLPTALSGRVSFELMLHCAKRLADLLKGKLEEEHQQAISAEYIDFMRYNIERFEYQEQQG
ncbi:MAG: hypothetical protein RIT27_616 [Pseudomonadota bacterium]|jgi:cell division protein ZipA